jgi:hypothetical protein
MSAANPKFAHSEASEVLGEHLLRSRIQLCGFPVFLKGFRMQVGEDSSRVHLTSCLEEVRACHLAALACDSAAASRGTISDVPDLADFFVQTSQAHLPRPRVLPRRDATALHLAGPIQAHQWFAREHTETYLDTLLPALHRRPKSFDLLNVRIPAIMYGSS